MTLRECIQLARNAGFDGIELNYDLDNDLSPKAGPKEFQAIRKMADDSGIVISGLCSFLFWPYSLTSNDAARRTTFSGQAVRKVRNSCHRAGVRPSWNVTTYDQASSRDCAMDATMPDGSRIDEQINQKPDVDGVEVITHRETQAE